MVEIGTAVLEIVDERGFGLGERNDFYYYFDTLALSYSFDLVKNGTAVLDLAIWEG